MQKKQLQYQKIEDDIIEKIENNTYASNAKIPSEAELCNTYGVSRMTVNKALTHLMDRGYIERIPGKGSFVRLARIERNIPEMLSFSEEHARAGITSRSKLMRYSVISAKECPKVIDKLGLEEDDLVHFFVRLRLGDERPLAVSYNYVSVKKVSVMDVTCLEKSLYEYLEKELGLVLSYNDTTIRVVNPTQEIREYLNFFESEDVVLSSHISYLDDNTPFEFTETYYIPSKYSFRYQCYRNRK